LQSQDVIESDTIPLTQEFLSHMLGVQRNSVSLAATALNEKGLIEYSRGNIKILNRDELTECSCECYEVVHDFVNRIAKPGKAK
jgi:Mn-dependent DtxR family transcriptional regulator